MMVEINLSTSAEVVRPLFKETVADGSRLFSALKGQHPAVALVDSAKAPHWCVLRSSWYGCTFIGGTIEPEELSLAIQQLRERGEILLNLADPHAASYPPGATFIEQRIEFTDRPADDPSVERLIASVPSKLKIEPVTADTFDCCLWRQPMLSLFGTISSYLEQSLGFLLLDGEHILSDAHAFFWGDTIVEIGVITAEGCRGLGYAPIVSAYLIRACEAKGFSTYWGCNADNPASITVARKLGYRSEHAYSNAYYPTA